MRFLRKSTRAREKSIVRFGGVSRVDGASPNS
jgi:hypothetical protein